MNRLYLFLSPVYWVSLVVLIANDFIFKKIYPGLITGKASDFAGLIILPLFIFGLFPEFFQTVKRKILLLVGSGTVLSLLQVQFFLDLFDELLLLFFLPRHNLTADGTDLIALSVLPFIYVFLQKRAHSVQSAFTSSRHTKAVHIFLGCISFIALSATSFIGVREVAVNELISAESDVGETLFNIQQRMSDEDIKTILMGVKGDSIYKVQVEFEDVVWVMHEDELKKDDTFFEGDLAFRVDQSNNSILLHEFTLLTWGRQIEDSTATRIFENRFKPLIF